MNAWQIAKQLRYKFRAQVWPETSGQLIWGTRVHCTNNMQQGEYAHLGAPAMLIAVNDDEQDDQSPGYVRQIFTLTYWCSVPGDMRGENALIGANRTAGAVSSSGRGILEYSEEVSRTVKQLQETLGVKIIGRRKSDVGTGIIDGLGYVAMRQTLFEAKCTDARYYHPPLRVAAAAAGGGNVTITWADPPTRFDGVNRTLRIRRAAGATAPTAVTGGTQVADVARGVQTYSDNPGAGTWSYAIFAGYTDTGAASNERYSEGSATEDGVVATVVAT